eukprot:5243140-Ditylum_brightwellii.AAC.1
MDVLIGITQKMMYFKYSIFLLKNTKNGQEKDVPYIFQQSGKYLTSSWIEKKALGTVTKT